MVMIDLLSRLHIDPSSMRGNQLSVLRMRTKQLDQTLRVDLGDWLRVLRRPGASWPYH